MVVDIFVSRHLLEYVLAYFISSDLCIEVTVVGGQGTQYSVSLAAQFFSVQEFVEPNWTIGSSCDAHVAGTSGHSNWLYQEASDNFGVLGCAGPRRGFRTRDGREELSLVEGESGVLRSDQGPIGLVKPELPCLVFCQILGTARCEVVERRWQHLDVFRWYPRSKITRIVIITQGPPDHSLHCILLSGFSELIAPGLGPRLKEKSLEVLCI